MQNAIDLAGMLRRREVPAREVISAHIERIEAFDPAINAVVTRTFDSALARASAADEAMARGEPPGLLHGLPVAHKDLADTAGVRTTYGSQLFAAHVPDRDALPAISVPAGFTPGGLPVGLQLVGKRRGDWDLLAVAHAFEAATGHAAITPDSAPAL